MTSGLSELSKSYYDEADVYAIFSEREDAPGKVFEHFLPHVAGRDVLDLGCGSGKYVRLFAPHARSIIGIDASAPQIAMSQKKTAGFGNVRLICAPVENTGLDSESIDVVICTWVLGTIADKQRRMAAIIEAERILKPGGSIFLVENDVGGEFEEIRGRMNDPKERTKQYNKWLEAEAGFSMDGKMTTRFGFASLEEARNAIGAIWGPAAAAKVSRPNIEHRIVVFAKRNAADILGA